MTTAQEHKFRARFGIAQVLVLLVLGLGTTLSPAQQPFAPLPIVTGAAVPFFPPLAQQAEIAGTVHLRLSTDGRRVSTIYAEDGGPPMLVKAAEENVRTWEFAPHKPTVFETTFVYRVLTEGECQLENGSVTLQLPQDVEISIKSVHTCDPGEVVPK
jgi:hypothetical protein